MPIDRRGPGDRRTPGRRLDDAHALERENRLARLDDPAAIAQWEIEWERAAAARARHVSALEALVLGLKTAAA